MHIYCDESGGSDPGSQIFVLSAVMIHPDDAARLLRGFRKTARPKVADEVKGHRLLPEQRALFFRLLSEVPSFSAASVCGRHGQPGAWAMSILSEPRLWLELMLEAMDMLPGHRVTGATLEPAWEIRTGG